MADPRTVEFHHDLYAKDALAAAAAAYDGLLSVELTDGDQSTQARLSEPSEEHGAILYDAFCNHVLFETIQQYRDQDEHE